MPDVEWRGKVEGCYRGVGNKSRGFFGVRPERERAGQDDENLV